MTTADLIKAYEDRLTQWWKARKEHRLDIGPEPDPADFHLDDWTANQVKKRVEREMSRIA